ncbi:MAG: ferredoxin [Firmicutes bacterium CAG:321_26_22]|nr:MAG: ferredoxin [Firmicutes bacterium CAG:321_26_22]
MEKAKVYFTKEITEESLVKIYEKLGIELKGNVAVKLHSGEEGNQNYLRPEFVKNIIDRVGGTVVECNTAYDGARNTTEKHKKLMTSHGWDKYYKVDIMDSEKDITLDIPNGHVINKDYVGSHLDNYDSMLVLSHFKGHPMGGYGGALKQLSIGVASSRGKVYIHTAGKTTDANKLWDNLPEQDKFLEAMADAASTVHNKFQGNIAYINVMKNMSVDCDCCAVAEDPCMKDIGVLASLDPIAIDKACIDLVYNSSDPGRDHLVERIDSRHGTHILKAADKLGFGTTDYELINIDK